MSACGPSVVDVITCVVHYTIDPDQIAAESPGGARVLYVALTRAAHRMTVPLGPRSD